MVDGPASADRPKGPSMDIWRRICHILPLKLDASYHVVSECLSALTVVLLTEIYRVFRDEKRRKYVWMGILGLFLILCSKTNFEISPEVYLQSLVPVHRHCNSTLSINVRQSPPYVIFYHIFVPHGSRAGWANALRIMQEQIDQVVQSYAVQSLQGTKKRLTIFYTTVGSWTPLPPAMLEQMCSPKRGIRCHHVAHYDNGFEEVTLERLYDFCQEHIDFQVIYIHSKGSYHNQGGENDPWRQAMMRAVLHHDCLEPPVTADQSIAAQCHVCGLLFAPVWTFFFPGNMWTAQCSYVRRLLRPSVFREKMTTLRDKLFRDYLSTGRLQAHLFPTDTNGYLGIHRFASEHWVAGHPDVRPCDLSNTSSLEYWRLPAPNSRQQRSPPPPPPSNAFIKEDDPPMFQWSMAPRDSIHANQFYRLHHDVLENILTSPSSSIPEYYLLAGYLFKWFELYGQAPPLHSWIWKWFPDGDQWKAAVTQHGNRSLEIMLQQHAAAAN